MKKELLKYNKEKFRTEFAIACLEYDLKSGTLVKMSNNTGIDYDDIIGIDNGDGTTSCDQTKDAWLDYYKTDVIDDEYKGMHGLNDKDLYSVYTILKNGLKDSVSPDELGYSTRIFPERMEKNPTRVC